MYNEPENLLSDTGSSLFCNCYKTKCCDALWFEWPKLQVFLKNGAVLLQLFFFFLGDMITAWWQLTQLTSQQAAAQQPSVNSWKKRLQVDYFSLLVQGYRQTKHEYVYLKEPYSLALDKSRWLCAIRNPLDGLTNSIGVAFLHLKAALYAKIGMNWNRSHVFESETILKRLLTVKLAKVKYSTIEFKQNYPSSVMCCVWPICVNRAQLSKKPKQMSYSRSVSLLLFTVWLSMRHAMWQLSI